MGGRRVNTSSESIECLTFHTKLNSGYLRKDKISAIRFYVCSTWSLDRWLLQISVTCLLKRKRNPLRDNKSVVFCFPLSTNVNTSQNAYQTQKAPKIHQTLKLCKIHQTRWVQISELKMKVLLIYQAIQSQKNFSIHGFKSFHGWCAMKGKLHVLQSMHRAQKESLMMAWRIKQAPNGLYLLNSINHTGL